MSFMTDLLMKDKDRKITKLGRIVQKFCKRVEDKWPFKHFDVIDDSALMGPGKGLKYFFWGIWDKITFSIFRERLFRSLAYAKQGWMSFDFDSHCALRDFCWKLERIAKHLETHAITTTCHKDAKKIRQVVYLFNRVMDDDYYQENCKPIDEKYGERVFAWDVKDDDDQDNNRHTIYRGRSKQTPENKEIIEELEKKAMQQAIYQRERDWSYALNIIKKYFFQWWD